MKRTIVIPVLLVAALTGACSSDDGTASDEARNEPASTSTTAATTTAPAEVDTFTGSDADFYRVPDDLPIGEPGDLIRTMPVGAPDGQTGLRIMYHSTDAEGDDRAVTGLVYFPTAKAPEGGWPIVAWAHGTSGLAPSCAPSRTPSPSPAYGVDGVRVATDYIGLGPEGEIHPYLSAAAEANAVIDSVTAVRGIGEAHAGDEWVVAGVSQGGHAALLTNERAAERLPGAKLLGAVALAPGSQLGETYGDDLQARAIMTMVLVGMAAEDPDFDLADYLSPGGVEVAAAVEHGCVADILGKLPTVAAAADYFVNDPRTSPVGVAWLEENDPGHVAAEAPLLLVQGDKDILVLPARTAALTQRLCAVGQVVETLDVAGADHNSVVGMSEAEVTGWVAARFAGTPPVDDC